MGPPIARLRERPRPRHDDGVVPSPRSSRQCVLRMPAQLCAERPNPRMSVSLPNKPKLRLRRDQGGDRNRQQGSVQGDYTFRMSARCRVAEVPGRVAPPGFAIIRTTEGAPSRFTARERTVSFALIGASPLPGPFGRRHALTSISPRAIYQLQREGLLRSAHGLCVRRTSAGRCGGAEPAGSHAVHDLEYGDRRAESTI